jgi:altronate hydrolase
MVGKYQSWERSSSMNMNSHLDIPFSQIAIWLDPQDPLAIAKRAIPAGTTLLSDIDSLPFQHMELPAPIPAGHKFALKGIPEGNEILRYGYKIGVATQDIYPGDWIHTHNLNVGDLTREFEVKVVRSGGQIETAEDDRFFMGYPRQGSRYGTRNYIAVVSTVSCSAQTAQAIAHAFPAERLAGFPHVDGVIALAHNGGCCAPIGSNAYRYLQRILMNLTRHPNVGGILFVSLGCENNQMGDLVENQKNEPSSTIIGPYLVIQKEGGVAKTIRLGVQAVQDMLPRVNEVARVRAPLSALTVALQCGGSDGWSGVTANPLVGKVSDTIVQAGGTVVLSETPEIYGAEHLLTSRSLSLEVGQKLIERIRWWQDQAAKLGFSLDNNPTPGNKEGGLTTIFEKSFGAISKAGSTPLTQVYEYAELVTSKGLVFMDAPGYDPVSVTGQVGGGCNMILFTTGRGSVYAGKLAPCIKVASNTDTYNRMADDMDYNAGAILDGGTIEAESEALLAKVLQAASGTLTKSEGYGQRDFDFIPWQPDATL